MQSTLDVNCSKGILIAHINDLSSTLQDAIEAMFTNDVKSVIIIGKEENTQKLQEDHRSHHPKLRK